MLGCILVWGVWVSFRGVLLALGGAFLSLGFKVKVSGNWTLKYFQFNPQF